MNTSATVTLDRKIGFGARSGRNAGIVYVVLFGLMLAFTVGLILKERGLERRMVALAAESIASSGFVLGGASWADLKVTYPDGSTEVIRHDFPVSEGSKITVYMLPDAPDTMQLTQPSTAKAIERSWWIIAIFSAGFLLGLYLVVRARAMRRDALNTMQHGIPYLAKVTHVGKLWLPGTFRFVGYVKWQVASGRQMRSMTLTTREASRFKIRDEVAVRAGSKRDWLQAELDLLT